MSSYNLLFKLAGDDENDPIEVLDEYLSGLKSVKQRAKALRYLLSEYENGQLEVYHRFRCENDSIRWPPDTPQEDMNTYGIIEQTIERVQKMLVSHVPGKLAQVERQLDYIKSGKAGVQEVKAILKDLDKKDSAIRFAEEPPIKLATVSHEGIEYLYHKDAMAFLGVGSSTLYHLTAEHHWAIKRKNSNRNLYALYKLQHYKADVTENSDKYKRPESQDGIFSENKPAEIELVNRAKKSKSS